MLNRHVAGSLRGRVVTYVVGATSLVLFVASLAILETERGKPSATIQSFGDAIVVVGVHRAHRRLRRQVISDDERFAGAGWIAGNTQDGSKMLSVGVELAKGRRPGAGELKA